MQNLKRNFILIGLIVLFGLVPVKNAMAEWTEVYWPSQTFTVECLYKYNSELFLGTSMHENRRTNRLRKYDGSSWQVDTTEFPEKGIVSFIEYNGEFYAGAVRGRVYKHTSLGTSWQTVHNESSSGHAYFAIYNNELYITEGSIWFGGKAKINKYDGTNWTDTNFWNLNQKTLSSLINHNNKLYAGTYGAEGENIGKIFEYDGANWSEIGTNLEQGVTSLEIYNGNLYAGTKDGGKIFEYDGTNFNMVCDTEKAKIKTLEIYNSKLYAGTETKIYEYDGSSCSENSDMSNIPDDEVAFLDVVDGKLHMGTSDTIGAGGKLFVWEGSSPPVPPIITPTTPITGGLIPCGRKTDNPDTDNVDERDECTVCHFFLMIKNIMDFITKIAVIVAILFISLGGLMYVLSTGNEAMLSKAKAMITYAIIGFILIFAAYIIIELILSTFGYTNPLGGEWDVIC